MRPPGWYHHKSLAILVQYYRIRPNNRTVRVEVGKGMLTIIRFTTPLNDCRSERTSRYCTFALSLFSLLRRSPLAKRLLIGQ